MKKEKREKIVWVTGASSGIGKSITEKFVENGVRVAATARREENLERIKNQLEKNNELLEIFPCDLVDLSSVQKTYKSISQKYDVICLINNAGVTTFETALDTNPDQVKSIIDTNLTATINITKTVLPRMIELKEGSIINILSVAAQIVFTKSSVYSASKAGVKAFADSLREELRENNIRVINVLPGATRTPMWPNQALEKYSNRMMSPNDLAKIVYDLFSIKSNLVPEEIRVKPILGDL